MTERIRARIESDGYFQLEMEDACVLHSIFRGLTNAANTPGHANELENFLKISAAPPGIWEYLSWEAPGHQATTPIGKNIGRIYDSPIV